MCRAQNCAWHQQALYSCQLLEWRMCVSVPMVGVALPVATWVSPGVTGCQTVVGSCRKQGPALGVCSSSYRVNWA